MTLKGGGGGRGLSDLISAGIPCVDKMRVFIDSHGKHIAGRKWSTQINKEVQPRSSGGGQACEGAQKAVG